MDCTPESLLQAARCFNCIPAGMAMPVGTYLMCAWSNKSSGPSCNSGYVVTPPDAATRNDFTGVSGMEFVVSSSVQVTRLGRKYIAGNTQNHPLNLWRTNGQLNIASGTVLASSPSDALGFKWVDVAPTVLSITEVYRIASGETQNADLWKEYWNPSGFLDPLFVMASTWGVYQVGATNAYPATLNGASSSRAYNTCAICFNLL